MPFIAAFGLFSCPSGGLNGEIVLKSGGNCWGGVEVGKVFVPLHSHTTSNFNLYLSFSSGWKLSVKMASTYCMVSEGWCWVCVPGCGGFFVCGGVSDDGVVLACSIMGEMKLVLLSAFCCCLLACSFCIGIEYLALICF